MRDRAPVTPYTVGVLTRAWGRGGEEPVPTRCVRLLHEPSAPPRTGVEPWQHPVDWYASFAFDGSVSRIEPACTWIAARWTPRAGLRLGYGPLLVLMEGLPDWRGRARATIHLSIAELPTG